MVRNTVCRQLWNRLANDLIDVISLESLKKKIKIFLNV